MLRAGLTIAVGLVSGILSGQFGLGGGFITTPAIRLVLGYPALIAVGTPLLVILPTALVGALSYARRGLADVRAGLVMGLAGSATSVAGALLSRALGGPAVMIVTAALILYVAVDMGVHTVRDRQTPETGSASGPPPARPSLARLVIIGVMAGLYSGLLGLGGGFLVVPALTRWLGLPLKRALGTSLVVVTILAVPGSITHYGLGHVDIILAAWLALGAVPGALIGAKLTALARERHVAIGFAVVMGVTGLVLGASEIAALVR